MKMFLMLKKDGLVFFSYKIISRIASQSELCKFFGGLGEEETSTICVESNDT